MTSDVLKTAQDLEEAAAHLQVDGHYLGAASICRRAARLLYQVAMEKGDMCQQCGDKPQVEYGMCDDCIVAGHRGEL